MRARRRREGTEQRGLGLARVGGETSSLGPLSVWVKLLQGPYPLPGRQRPPKNKLDVIKWNVMPDFPCTFPTPTPGRGLGKPTPVLRLSSVNPEGPSTQLLAETSQLRAPPPHRLTLAHQPGLSQAGLCLTPSCQAPRWMLFSSARLLGVCASTVPPSRHLWLPLVKSSPPHAKHLHQPYLAFLALFLAPPPTPIHIPQPAANSWLSNLLWVTSPLEDS